MVTSRKASEKNVGNRGSKSVIFKSINFIVKEQRVNGSCFINKNLMKLRCTLMGNERSYQVKIPSNQIIQRRFFSIEPYLKLTLLIEPWFITGFTDAEGCFLVINRKSTKNKLSWQQNSSNSSIAKSAQLKFVLDPWFITGFTDGDGCLGINIYKDNAYKRGWGVKLFFEIHLHKKDTDLLQKIKEFFNVGKVYNSKPNSSKYFVTSIADLQVIKNHFNNYPLHTPNIRGGLTL
jgi:LAGLIDADG endonuclease